MWILVATAGATCALSGLLLSIRNARLARASLRFAQACSRLEYQMRFPAAHVGARMLLAYRIDLRIRRLVRQAGVLSVVGFGISAISVIGSVLSIPGAAS